MQDLWLRKVLDNGASGGLELDNGNMVHNLLALITKTERVDMYTYPLIYDIVECDLVLQEQLLQGMDRDPEIICVPVLVLSRTKAPVMDGSHTRRNCIEEKHTLGAREGSVSTRATWSSPPLRAGYYR